MSVILIILIVFSLWIASMFSRAAEEAFGSGDQRRTRTSMVTSPQLPYCQCPQCVLAQSADTYNNIEHDKLACVRANSGGPIYYRNRYNEWGKDTAAWRNQIPVNGYSYGFYEF